MLNLHIENKKELFKKASDELNRLLSVSGQRPVLLLLSGGSALSILDHVRENCLSPALTVVMLDERFSKKPSERNFDKLTSSLFWTKAERLGVALIDSRPIQKESMEDVAARMHSEVLDWRGKNKNGFIAATLGMGVDGHTAGVFPFPENPKFFWEVFENTECAFVGYDAGKKTRERKRITATIPLFRAVDRAVAVISGAAKARALGRLFSPKGFVFETPARIWHEMQSVQVFTDISVDFSKLSSDGKFVKKQEVLKEAKRKNRRALSKKKKARRRV
ncbi:MAG: 6-phosphogluconolactonase [bacterium]|nr:6-phosphogluconolactonase [bacterium]